MTSEKPITMIEADAPVVSRHDIDIAAPVAIVWKIQTDVSSWPQWRPTVSTAHLDGAIHTGAVFKWVEGPLEITSTVQEMTANRRIVWTGPAQGIVAVHVWEFAPTPAGVHVHTEESWSGEVAKAQKVKLQPMLDGALVDWLNRLKARSEAEAALAT